MSLPTESRAILKKLLTVVAHRATHLREILEQEYHALLAPQPSELPAITTRKIDAIEKLETADQVLRDVAARVAKDHQADSQLADILADCPECLARWERICQTLVSLRDANQRNGAILNKNQQRVTRILTIITGREPFPDYDRQGGVSLGTASRSLAKA